MKLDPITLGVVIGGTALLGGVALYVATSQLQRIMLTSISVGLLVFNGIGAAYPDVPWYYLVYYFGFFLAFLLSFKFFTILFLPMGRRVGKVLPVVLESVDRHRGWQWVIPIYFALNLVPLVYPEFHLFELFDPGAPDLVTHFAKRFIEQELNIVLKLVKYAMLLLTPFFYIALYRYRRRFLIVILILVSLAYIRYIDVSYIGRGNMVIVYGVIAIAIWVYKPQNRKRILLVTLAILPVFLAFSYYWAAIRIGGEVEQLSFWNKVAIVVEGQINFPLVSGMPIIESQERANLFEYFKWIVTLPMPKIVTGQIGGARINYEIAEAVLGFSRGTRGFFVLLPGLVSEAVYIYGRDFMWFHGAFLGGLIALIVRLLERTPQFLFLNSFIVVLFAYALNRGGISSALPQIANGFLLFYFFVFISVFKQRTTRRRFFYGLHRVADE